MLWRRYASHFNSANLNYEALARKVQKFHRQSSHSSAEITDYVVANRRLQAINRRLDPHYKFAAPNHRLELTLNVAGSDLEQELWVFLRRYWSLSVASEDVVRAYVLSCSRAHAGRAIELVTAHYNHQNASFWRCRNSGLVRLLLRKLLENNDYHNSFELLDSTINSTVANLRRKKALISVYGMGASIVMASSLAHHLFAVMEISTLWPDIMLSFAGSSILTSLCLLGMQALNFPRISWRPHTSLAHRCIHHEEMVNINRLVTFFEEHHEINVKNFHVSQIRTWPSGNTFQENDYELILPSPNDSSLVFPQAEVFDKHYDSMVQHLKAELLHRKMSWNPLKEEKMFLQFWLSHGDNFEWVEPDQDPAEMPLLQTSMAYEKG